MSVHFERISVKTVESILGADPEESLLVLKETSNLSVGQPLFDSNMLEDKLWLAVLGTTEFGQVAGE